MIEQPVGSSSRAAPKPFYFVAEVGAAQSRTDFIEGVRAVEQLGYHALYRSDHLVDQLGPIAALGVAAAVTTRLRLGSFVLNNDLRHPVVLAQELATLDRLSDGRLDVGIGAGWNIPEYEGIGLPFDPGPRRIDRLAEAVAVLKAVFGEGPVDFEGTFYRVHGFADLPRPVQRPHPPFLIGGGSPKLLRLAAQAAEIVGIAPRVGPDGKPDVAGCTWEGSARKIGVIRTAAAGRAGQLQINTYPSFSAQVTDHPRPVAREIADRIQRRYGVELSLEDVLESPHVFVGSVAGLVEKFKRLRAEFGISHIFIGESYREFAPVVERLLS